MQVNNVTSQVPEVKGSTSARRPARTERSEVAFKSSQSLERRLEAEPAVRAEAVERGRQLFESVKYPPDELIDKLSVLLARDWLEAED